MYNAKLIQYENGMVELRTYSDYVGKDNSNHYTEKPCDCEIEEYNPFSRKVETFVKLPCSMSVQDGLKAREENKEYSEEERARRSRANSFKRTVQSIYALSRQCEWEYFITLTFDNEKTNRYDFDECMKKAKKWFNNQRNRYAPELQYLCVPEMHKDGAWHIHGLVANVGNMDIGKVSRVVDKKKLPNGKWITLKQPLELLSVGGWKFGFSDASIVNDVRRVSSYIVKYITKELCELTQGKHRYFRSNNIPEVAESEFQIPFDEVDNFIELICEQLDLQIGYSKEIKGEYLNCKYIFFDDRKEIENEKE